MLATACGERSFAVSLCIGDPLWNPLFRVFAYGSSLHLNLPLLCIRKPLSIYDYPFLQYLFNPTKEDEILCLQLMK